MRGNHVISGAFSSLFLYSLDLYGLTKIITGNRATFVCKSTKKIDPLPYFASFLMFHCHILQFFEVLIAIFYTFIAVKNRAE